MVKSKFGTFWKISCNYGTSFYNFSIFSITFCYKVCYLCNLHKNDRCNSARKTHIFSIFFRLDHQIFSDIKKYLNILIYFLDLYQIWSKKSKKIYVFLVLSQQTHMRFQISPKLDQEVMNLIQKVLSGEPKCQKTSFSQISLQKVPLGPLKSWHTYGQLLKLYNFLIEYSSQNPSFIGDPGASSKCEFVGGGGIRNQKKKKK